jgi:hypothetical protein
VELAAIFNQELAATRETVAQAVAVEIRPGAGVRVVDAAGYPLEHRDDGTVVFRPGSLFAGQERRIWVSFEVTGEGGVVDLGRVTASYVRDAETYTVALEGLPKVERLQDEKAVYASIDRETWERSVVEEDYSRLRQRLASLVHRGQSEDALQEINSYRAKKTEINEVLDSAPVRRNLTDLEVLETQVKDAFTGTGQVRKQNLLSKTQQAGAWDQRRGGSKKAPKAKQ